MIKKTQKLSIYLKSNDVDIIYSMNPVPKNSDGLTHHYEIDINQPNKIKLELIKKSYDDSFLQISKIMLNDIELNHFDQFINFYVNGKIRKTYGWLDSVGCCIIKVHTNAVSQNLLNYLLSGKNG
jgi:hypothetical protein